jgi:hypothetical protein
MSLFLVVYAGEMAPIGFKKTIIRKEERKMYNSFNQPGRMNFPNRSRESSELIKCSHCDGSGTSAKYCCQKKAGIRIGLGCSAPCCTCLGRGVNRL